MLTLGEELLILSIEDGKGALTPFTSDTLRYGLAGAILADLALQEKVTLEKSRLALVDLTSTGDAILDEVIAALAKESKPRKVIHWINSMGSKKITRRIISQLTNKGVLRSEEHRYSWVIPYEENPLMNASAKYWLKMQLRTIVLAGKEPELRMVLLLSLLRACRLLNLVFTRDERLEVGRQVGELVKGETIGEAVAYVIKKIETAASSADA
jgi:Golgi phosphoprotein 3